MTRQQLLQNTTGAELRQWRKYFKVKNEEWERKCREGRVASNAAKAAKKVR